MKLSIIIPVYNEEKTILEIIKQVKKSKIRQVKKEIIIVDDGSFDNTPNLLKKIKDKSIKIILSKENRGKGASIKKGLGYCTGDIILIQDADLEYNPQEYEKLIEPIIKDEYKIVYGSRLKGKNKRGKLAFFIGGILVTLVTDLLFFAKLTDEPTCYKVFHKEVIHILNNAQADRFEWEPEVTAKLLRKGYKIKEVPISYSARLKGKHIKAKDGFIAILTLIKWRFKKI
jgi:glycosyltransferase involved in cell wall biosynthesis